MQPVRTVIPIDGDHAFFGHDAGLRSRERRRRRPRDGAALGAKLVTVFGSNAARGCTPSRVDRAAGSGDRRAAGAARRPLHHRSADGGGVRGVVAAARAENGAVARDHRHRASRRAATSRRCRECTRCGRSRCGVRTNCTATRFVEEAKTATGSDPGLTPSEHQRGGSRRRSGRRRRHHRPGHLVADAGPRERLGEAGRARDLGRRLPADSARDGSGARRPRRGCSSTRAPRRSSNPATSCWGFRKGASAPDHIVAELGELVAGRGRAAAATPRSRSSSRLGGGRGRDGRRSRLPARRGTRDRPGADSL